jgi:hypothetical protein
MSIKLTMHFFIQNSLKKRHYPVFGHFFCPFLDFGNTFDPLFSAFLESLLRVKFKI